jgi:hypothetical protein
MRNSHLNQVMDGHTNSVICLLVVNRLMYTGSADGTAKGWVTEYGDCTRQYKGHKGSVICMKFRNGIRKSVIKCCSARNSLPTRLQKLLQPDLGNFLNLSGCISCIFDTFRNN